MKRFVLAAFCIIVLCSTGLVMKTGNVSAYQTGYDVTDYEVTYPCTVDGTWTDPNEWVDADERQLDGSLNAIFRLKYISGYPLWAMQYYLIEFLDDTTNDAGDYWQICYAAADEQGGTPNGGTTPQTDCARWDFVGHDVTGFKFYRGDGSAWVESIGYSWNVDIHIVDGFGTSPLSDTPHWIVEIRIEHMAYDIYPNFWIRIAAYDESNAGAGVQAWPSGSVDVPDDWGFVTYLAEPIPEALTVGVMVILLSVSVLIVPHYFRKWSRNKSCNARKSEK